MSTVVEILGQVGALLTDDHFVYSSGKHGDIYINKNDLFAYTRAIEQTGVLLAENVQRCQHRYSSRTSHVRHSSGSLDGISFVSASKQ